MIGSLAARGFNFRLALKAFELTIGFRNGGLGLIDLKAVRDSVLEQGLPLVPAQESE